MALPPGWPSSTVLASASPRRLQLLQSIGVSPEVRIADLDETPLTAEKPLLYVARLAREKAIAVARPDEVVIAADTTIDLDDRIVGKPSSRSEALRTLRELSGRKHHVHTGVAVVSHSNVSCIVVTSVVTMVQADDGLLEWYVDTGEPYGKAGGYAIQGAGAILISTITGSIANVMGLPVAELYELMSKQLKILPISRNSNDEILS